MTVAILSDDLVGGEVVATLLGRVEIDATVFRRPRTGTDRDAHIVALRTRFAEVLVVGEPIPGTRALAIEPSLEACLTRDPDANRAVLGTDEVPTVDDARAWLGALEIDGGRRYSAAIDGRRLAQEVDLSLVAASSSAFRALLAALRPAWAGGQPIKRGRGRPPGVQLFHGSGYALCLELLHLGERAEATTGDLASAIGLTKSPALRMIGEAERRGFLRRTSPRGPVQVRNTDRLLDDLVTSVKAEAARTPRTTVGLRSDRDRAGLPARVATALAEMGRTMAITGAAAVLDIGGDLLVGAPVRAYASMTGLPPVLVDAYPDPRAPSLVLVEPADEAMLHRMAPGTPATVSPWQAVIDLLASDNAREREVGARVRHRLERS